MIKTFESFKDYSKIVEVIKVIDYVMLNFTDMGFEESTDSTDISNYYSKNTSNYFSKKIYKKYTRPKSTKNIIQINGYVENGKIFFISLNPKNRYSEEDSDIANEFIDSIITINSVTGEKIHFSFTNTYGEDKILIYLPKKL